MVRYKRIFGRVTREGVNANTAQVRRGMAWVYDGYAKDRTLYRLEDGARRAGRGFWADRPRGALGLAEALRLNFPKTIMAMKMLKNLHTALFIALSCFCISKVAANELSDIFEAASKSIVVVNSKNSSGEIVSQGSGVIVSPAKIATNCHVIEGGVTIEVVYSGKEYGARLSDTDWMRDLCSIDVSNFRGLPAKVGNVEKLRVGDRVIAIGAPRGLTLTLSEGIISSLREHDGGHLLQITAPISPGSSGGGVFNYMGELIGLPTFYVKDGQQLNFAIPANWIEELPDRNSKNRKSQNDFNWLLNADALDEAQSYDELLSLSRKWVLENPESANAWLYLGVSSGNLNKKDLRRESFSAIKRALDIDPSMSRGWSALGVAFLSEKRANEALNAFDKAIYFDINNFRAHYGRARLHASLNQTVRASEGFNDAVRVCLSLLTRDPKFVPCLNVAADSYKRLGRRSDSIHMSLREIKARPSVRAWVLLGRTYGENNQFRDALSAFFEASALDPSNLNSLYWIGVTYAEMGDFNSALDVYNRLAQTDQRRAEKLRKIIVNRTGQGYGE